MTRKKQIRIFLGVIFWIAIYFIARSQRFEADKNPYLMAVMYAVFIFHIGYEGIYKKKKIENKKNEIKSRHLSELKSKMTDITPEINTDDLPTELTELIPLFKKWGIENKMLREDLYENAKKDELIELKSIENKREIIEKWIEINSDNQKVSKALNLTLKSYDELGLWTWEANN